MDAKIAEIDGMIQQAEELKFTDFKKCMELGEKAHQQAKEIDYEKGIADGLFYMGMSKYFDLSIF